MNVLENKHDEMAIFQHKLWPQNAMAEYIYIYNSHQSLNPWKNWRLGHIQTPKMVHKKQQHNPFIWFSRVQKNLFDNIVYIYIHKSIYLPIYLSIYLSMYLSIYLSIFVYIYIACFLHVCILHCIVYIHEFHHFHWFFNAVACLKKKHCFQCF